MWIQNINVWTSERNEQWVQVTKMVKILGRERGMSLVTLRTSCSYCRCYFFLVGGGDRAILPMVAFDSWSSYLSPWSRWDYRCVFLYVYYFYADFKNSFIHMNLNLEPEDMLISYLTIYWVAGRSMLLATMTL
jgi:hypothetical protein